MTTSSTLVTSSTVIFSGYLQLNVFVAGQGAWEFVDTEETNIVDGAVSAVSYTHLTLPTKRIV